MKPTPQQIAGLEAQYPNHIYSNGVLWRRERVVEPSAPKSEVVIITQYWHGLYDNETTPG